MLANQGLAGGCAAALRRDRVAIGGCAFTAFSVSGHSPRARRTADWVIKLKTFLFLLSHSKSELTIASVAIIISGLGMTGLIIQINKFLRADSSIESVVMASFLGICVLIIGSRILSGYVVNRLVSSSLSDLRLKLAHSVLAVPLKAIEGLGENRILPALTTDTARINSALTAFPYFLRSLIILVCCLIYMALLSWQGFLMVVGLIVITVSFYRLVSRRAVVYQRKARREWDTLFGHFKSLVQGIKEFKLHAGKRADLIRVLIAPSEEMHGQHTVRGATIHTLAMSVAQTMAFVTIGCLFFVFPLITPVTPEMLVGFTFLLIYMFGPLEGAITWLPQLMQADVAMDSIQQLGLSLERQSKKTQQKELTAVEKWRSLELRNVSHTYYSEKENGKFTLGPISLTLSPGELVFIVGGNGSGKTTLAKVLSGLYAPESGTVLLNGVEVSDENRDHYCGHFSAVFSDAYLSDNLLGLSTLQLSNAQGYLIALQLNHKVQVTDNKFSTIDLSQGQRKRLALLVAYLEDRPIYLFDEWAADQDPLFKDVFYTKLLPELKARGKAVVVITHDDRYYALADRVIKLESGQIVR
jgi:putative pyoverdin transport system ATP-binding/permease protein